MGFSRQEHWSGVPLPSPIEFNGNPFLSGSRLNSQSSQRTCCSHSAPRPPRIAGASSPVPPSVRSVRCTCTVPFLTTLVSLCGSILVCLNCSVCVVPGDSLKPNPKEILHCPPLSHQPSRTRNSSYSCHDCFTVLVWCKCNCYFEPRILNHGN